MRYGYYIIGSDNNSGAATARGYTTIRSERTENGVRKERSGWRDPGLDIRVNAGNGLYSAPSDAPISQPPPISSRHRRWKSNLYLVDIDFVCDFGCEPGEDGWVVLEYSKHGFRAIIVYKVEGAQPPSPYSAKVMSALAHNSGIPFLVVYYSRDYSKFRIVHEDAREEILNEKYYQEFLCSLSPKPFHCIPTSDKEHGASLLANDETVGV